MNLVLLDRSELDSEGRVTLDDHRARHLEKVLGVAIGSRIRVGIIDGPIGAAEVRELSPQGVTLHCTWGEIPAVPRIDILLALPRPKVIGRLYSSLAQLGIRRLMLSNAARVERYYFDAHQLDPEYRRARLLDGLAQAKDTHLPLVTVHKSLRTLIEDELPTFSGEGLRLMADPMAHTRMRQACQDIHGESRVLLAIGPEGGWNDFERELLQAHGFHPVGMGPRTLRTDIATVALISLASEALQS